MLKGCLDVRAETLQTEVCTPDIYKWEISAMTLFRCLLMSMLALPALAAGL